MLTCPPKAQLGEADSWRTQATVRLLPIPTGEPHIPMVYGVYSAGDTMAIVLLLITKCSNQPGE